MANSRERVDARRSKSPPTLTHAIARRSATAAVSAMSIGRMSPSIARVNGTTLAAVIFVDSLRPRSGVRFTIAANSSAAAVVVTPRARRPIAITDRPSASGHGSQ